MLTHWVHEQDARGDRNGSHARVQQCGLPLSFRIERREQSEAGCEISLES